MTQLQHDFRKRETDECFRAVSLRISPLQDAGVSLRQASAARVASEQKAKGSFATQVIVCYELTFLGL